MMERETLFSSGLSRGIMAAAAILVLLSVVLALYGGKLIGPRPTEMDTYSHNAIGHRALFDFYQSIGHQSTRLTELQHARVEDPLFFIEPQESVRYLGKRHTLRAALQTRYDKGFTSVLVLPKWRIRKRGGELWAESRSASSIRFWLRSVLPEIGPRLHIQRLLAHADIGNKAPQMPSSQNIHLPLRSGFDRASGEFRGTPKQVELKLLLPQRFSLVSAKGAGLVPSKHKKPPAKRRKARSTRKIQVVMGSAKGAYVLRISAPKRGDIWLISDPDLLHNFNLQRGQHAIFWYTLASRYLGRKRLFFDECFHNHVATFSLTQELARFPQILLVLQALFLLGLFGWYGARRFGVHRPIVQRLGRGPQEIIDITAWVLVCGQAVEQVTASYIVRVLQDTAERLQLKGNTRTKLALELDRMAMRKGLGPEAESLQLWVDTALQGKQKAKDALRHAHRAWQFRRGLLARRIIKSSPDA